jgi:membrane protein implicated in regulation of membrane protease activity
MVYWHWLILAALFAVIELAAPAMVCLWFAVAALGVALLAWLFPALAWEYQGFLFALLAIGGVAFGRLVLARPRPAPGEPHLNRRGESHIGRLFTLDQPIVDGRGRLKVDDTVWLVEGPDLPAGTRVRVSGARGTLLTVEPL